MEELFTPSNILKAFVYGSGLVGMVYANKLHIQIIKKRQDKISDKISKLNDGQIKNCTDIEHLSGEFKKLEDRCYDRHSK